MKRIILVDRSAGDEESIVEYILQQEVYIVTLVVDNDTQKEQWNNIRGIGQVITVAELDQCTCTKGINYKIIQKCKPAQLLVENALMRYETDYHEKKYRYYMALSYWNQIFSNDCIDLILINSLLHGLIFDGVLFGMASAYQVPMLTVNRVGIHTWDVFIREELSRCMIPVQNRVKIQGLGKYLENEATNTDVLHLGEDDGFKSNWRIAHWLYKFFGQLGIDFFRGIWHGDIYKKKRVTSSGFYTSYFTELKNYYVFSRVKRFLFHHEQKADLTCNYIYCSLHFEPEANIQCRVLMESQLVAIKMLSECLPIGWKIFVKEHPYQFKLNNNAYSYFIHNSTVFRNALFYQNIIGMDNVVLVSHTYNSKDLIEGAKGVATFNGSAAIETVMAGRPLLLFSDTHPFIHLKDVFVCFDYRSCEEALQTIEQGIIPDYSAAIDTMNQWVCSSREDFVDNCVRIVKDMLGSECKSEETGD